jgi:Protein of unknown function (DUF2867)
MTSGRRQHQAGPTTSHAWYGDTADNPSWIARTLFAIRWKLGELLGWDDPDAGVGSRVPTLRDRLPADLRDAPAGPEFDTAPLADHDAKSNPGEWPDQPDRIGDHLTTDGEDRHAPRVFLCID